MKYFRLFILPILVVSLVGCVIVEESVEQPEETAVATEDPVAVEKDDDTEAAPDAEEKSPYDDLASFKAFIEDSSNYTILEDVEEKRRLANKSERCTHLDDFMDKTFNGDIAYLDLGENTPGMRIYVSPNYEAWTTMDVQKEFMYFADGLGVKEPVKAYPDRLLWAYPSCGGVDEPKESPSYDRYQECLKVSKLLIEYLENEPDYVTSAEARAEYEQDENYEGRCTY
jgi:hypothetical protein